MRQHSLVLTVTSAVAVATNAAAAAIDKNKNLRTNSSPQLREHIVRRLYGEDNALVRKEISQVEERMTRYKTGLNADPDHRVDYDDHPFEPSQRHRNAQSANTTAANKFRPMRIKFYTKALDDIRNSTNAAKIDWYKNEVLPAAAAFWSSTLSVVPVSGNLRISSGELDSFDYCGDPEFTSVPKDHKSTGIENADLMLYVSGSASERFCPARTLAVAVPCNFDQFDRPTAGAVNVCLDNIQLNSDGTASKEVFQDYMDVTIHEVGHVLGHSSNSYKFYWDPDTGTPRTSRPFSEKSVTCVDRSVRTAVLPAENTLKFLDDGVTRYAMIVTPKVQAVARNQFNCQTLAGGQLEKHPTRAESCVGDHWDERMYYPEAMSGVISPTANILSALTLALLEDSGWYRANYTNSRMSPWGLGVGCDFVEKPCLVINSAGETVVPIYSKGFFCNEGAAKGCSNEHTHKLACRILDYNFYVPQVLPASQYQYFQNEPSKGGSKEADYCPIYANTYNNLEVGQLACANPSNLPTLNVYRYANICFAASVLFVSLQNLIQFLFLIPVNRLEKTVYASPPQQEQERVYATKLHA
jgi:leishmanolysin-like peptidase